MALIARIIGVSVLTAGLGVVLGFALFQGSGDARGISFVLGCIGAFVGALAGTANEIVTAVRQSPRSGKNFD